MKTVPQNMKDLFEEMVEENKDVIKTKMKDTLLSTIGEIPKYITQFIDTLGNYEEEDTED